MFSVRLSLGFFSAAALLLVSVASAQPIFQASQQPGAIRHSSAELAPLPPVSCPARDLLEYLLSDPENEQNFAYGVILFVLTDGFSTAVGCAPLSPGYAVRLHPDHTDQAYPRAICLPSEAEEGEEPEMICLIETSPGKFQFCVGSKCIDATVTKNEDGTETYIEIDGHGNPFGPDVEIREDEDGNIILDPQFPFVPSITIKPVDQDGDGKDDTIQVIDPEEERTNPIPLEILNPLDEMWEDWRPRSQ